MAKYKMSKEEKAARAVARWKIIQEANKWKLRVRYKPVLAGMKNLQRCVFICRQRGLVSNEVLIAAGFRPDTEGRAMKGWQRVIERLQRKQVAQ